MGKLVDEQARVLGNEVLGPRLHLLTVEAPEIATGIKPGQFVHVKVPGADQHVLRRPFSVYARSAEAGTLEILYQEVGSITEYMPSLSDCDVQMIGPIGNTWSGPALHAQGACGHALLVGGGVGAAPLFLMAKELVGAGCAVDVVLGAQTAEALVTRERYEQLLGRNPICATDDGTYGHAGFCTGPVEGRLREGCTADGSPYDYVAVCGPEPLMKIVAGMALDAGVRCEVSMEKRMACGVGACLSCVVDTVDGKRRSCVDGPIFDASEVVW